MIVESGSMMHADSEVSYGRFGTIDPGDLVLVKDVDDVDDITTLVEGGREHYGMPGDVIIYFRANDRARTPIIHRAVAYVEVVGPLADPTYYVRWSQDAPCEGDGAKVERDGRPWCRYGAEGILIPSIPVRGHAPTGTPEPYRPVASGFLTKGDNPVTNRDTDQFSGLSRDEDGKEVPVPIEWIEGEARAELPWLGLIKLALANTPNESNPPAAWVKIRMAYAPRDLWVMLAVTLFIVVGVPLLYDGYKAIAARRAARSRPAAPAALDAQPTPEGFVRLSWSDVANAHSYRVYRGDERIASVSTTEHVDRAIAPGAAHSYAVSAVNERGAEGPRSPTAHARIAGPGTT